MNDIEKKVADLQDQLEAAQKKLEAVQKKDTDDRNKRLYGFVSDFLNSDLDLNEDVEEEPYPESYSVEDYSDTVSVNVFGVYGKNGYTAQCDVSNWDPSCSNDQRVVVQLTVEKDAVDDLLEKYGL